MKDLQYTLETENIGGWHFEWLFLRKTQNPACVMMWLTRSFLFDPPCLVNAKSFNRHPHVVKQAFHYMFEVSKHTLLWHHVWHHQIWQSPIPPESQRSYYFAFFTGWVAFTKLVNWFWQVKAVDCPEKNQTLKTAMLVLTLDFGFVHLTLV